MSGPRVGLIGARRQRQGLGPFVARDLLAAGAEVPCFLATQAETRDVAERELLETYGIAARGYLDLEAMLRGEALDALAILSPSETHGDYLDAALSAGLHVLCEKPLVWGEPDPAARAAQRVTAFGARELLLWENCQWPYTLGAYAELFPGALDTPPRLFEMTLEPASAGLESLADTLSHPLSLLQAFFPGQKARIDGLRFSRGAREECVAFAYVAERGNAEVRLTLRPSQRLPREASLALDSRLARRVVSGEDYRLSFAGADRSVEMADPLTSLVADFVRDLIRPDRERAHQREREIAERMRLFASITAAYRGTENSQ